MMTLPTPVVRLCAAAAFGALAAGCAESAAEGEWGGSIETLPNGVEIVRNPAEGIWAEGGGWRIVEEVRVGSLASSGPELFGRVIDLHLDEFGRMFVLDAQANEVRVFDAEGGHVRTFGRQGGGPGEMDTPGALLAGPDGNLWVVDQRHGRFSVFDTAGVYLTSHPRPGGIIVMPWPGGFDNAGEMHDIAVIPRPDGRSDLGFVRYDRNLQPADTFAQPRFDAERFEIRTGNSVMATSVPFAPYQVRELAPDGNVWLGVNDRYRLHLLDYAGDTLRIIEREHSPLPVTSADREASMAQLQSFIDRGGTVDLSRIPSMKPAFRDLFVDDAGNLWVRPAANDVREDLLFDIFDPLGRYLGRIESPFPISMSAPVVIRENTLLAVTEDDLGVQYVVRARIVKSEE